LPRRLNAQRLSGTIVGYLARQRTRGNCRPGILKQWTSSFARSSPETGPTLNDCSTPNSGVGGRHVWPRWWTSWPCPASLPARETLGRTRRLARAAPGAQPWSSHAGPAIASFSYSPVRMVEVVRPGLPPLPAGLILEPAAASAGTGRSVRCSCGRRRRAPRGKPAAALLPPPTTRWPPPTPPPPPPAGSCGTRG
jgi:hypothetical protein